MLTYRDWEADCVGHKGVFTTLTERKSKLYLSFPIKNKIAKETNAGILRLLETVKAFVMALTFNNGREFSRHGELAKQLKCETYFTKPYHSWEHSLNENHNDSLSRAILSKGNVFGSSKRKGLFKITDLMTNRYRKWLGVGV